MTACLSKEGGVNGNKGRKKERQTYTLGTTLTVIIILCPETPPVWGEEIMNVFTCLNVVLHRVSLLDPGLFEKGSVGPSPKLK